MAGVPVRVLIADDEKLAAAGTTAALDSGDGFELVGVAASAARAAELAESEQPDVALVSACVPGGGDDAVRAILTASPDTRVLAHSGDADHSEVVAMLRAGAGGFLVRGAPPRKLMAALRAAAQGDTIFDGTVNGAVLRELMDQVHACEPRPRGDDHQACPDPRVLEREELDIVFQPIVALDSRGDRGLRGAVALLRRAAARSRAVVRRGARRWASGRSSSWRRSGSPASARATSRRACSWRSTSRRSRRSARSCWRCWPAAT